MSIRPVKKIIQSKPTLEGAGVHLRRAFGFGDTKEFDPFLLLDDFRNDKPEEYLAGFPWHPHRGIETITYVLAGEVDHGDSLGNKGTLGAGDVQWMTAGRGLVHSEMPEQEAGRMRGFQLWINLPAKDKMTAPKYQEFAPDGLPVVAPASALPGAKNEHYADEKALLFALADALHEEYKAIVDAGLYVQIDDAFLPYMHEKMVPPMSEAQYRAWAQLRIDALNHALRGIPEERSRYHICWGSWHGPHVHDLPLKDIIDLLLKVRVQGYVFEAANARHEHEWQIWQDVKLPDDRLLIPGVVSHCVHLVEHPELVAQRIVRFADVVGRERVIAGTDCGFGTSGAGDEVHPDVAWAKLNALVAGAQIATRRLWER